MAALTAPTFTFTPSSGPALATAASLPHWGHATGAFLLTANRQHLVCGVLLTFPVCGRKGRTNFGADACRRPLFCRRLRAHVAW